MALRDSGRAADSTSAIQMGPILVRLRFVMLWLVAGAALAGTMAVFFYEPGVLEEGVAGEMEGEPVTTGTAMLSAAMVAVPLALAAITLFLTTRASAIMNLVAGVALGAFGLFAVVTHVADGAWPAHLTLAAFTAVIAWLIVGLSIAELRRAPAGERRTRVGKGRLDGSAKLGRPAGPRSPSPRESSSAGRRRPRAGASH